MKKFQVGLEADGFISTIIVEATNKSDAIKLAREKHCAPRMIEVTPHPTWVGEVPDDADEDYEIFDESYNQVFHDCEDCKTVLFEGPGKKDNDWPWQYAAGDDGHHTYICYPCAMKRKEAGNYCAYFKNYYRDDHHHGCDSCPVGTCHKARDSYYEALKTMLGRALVLSASRPMTEVKEFLDNNEFGLVYDALKEVGAGTTAGPRFDANMVKAKEMMEEGWE